MKKHSFTEPLWKGFVTLVTLLVIYKLIAWILGIFYSSTSSLRELIMSLTGIENQWVGFLLTIMLLLPVFWLIGKIPLFNLIILLFKQKAGIGSRKYLYTAKITDPHFFGGLPIGLVTKEIIRDNKKYYNICFPNLGGFWTIPYVPEECVERTEHSIFDILLCYLSCGSL